jgi:hypothetical protein
MRWLLKRWWFWAGTGFMLVAVCAGYLLIPVEKPRITQENCDRIQLGWSWEQVTDLLGIREHRGKAFMSMMEMRTWYDDDDNRICVDFKTDDELRILVTNKEFIPTEFSFWERIKRRIERRIRALWP